MIELPDETNPARVLVGDALATLRRLPDGCVHCCVTSPPYWALRDYGVAGQIGLEPTPAAFVARLVEVFEEVRRVLHPSGVCWVNMGDSYSSGAGGNGAGRIKSSTLGGAKREVVPPSVGVPPGLKPKDLCGVPWRIAFALQEAGWYLRSDIPWVKRCLSGGTVVYARTQKGDMPSTIKDLARLDPKTVKLWNGQKWTQVVGWLRTARNSQEVELVLRSGERISCTPVHRFPTSRGLLPASEIRVGDKLVRVTLPEPDNTRRPEHIGLDAAWLAGLFIAEGHRSEDSIILSGHTKETDRWERCKAIAESYGGYARLHCKGNVQRIHLHGKVLNALLDELVSGRTAKDKCLAPVCWRYGNGFLSAILDGYLDGDGHWDQPNNRWRLGFTRNYNLERDLRVLSARLGFKLSLKFGRVKYKGTMRPTLRGEIRFEKKNHPNCRSVDDVIEIRKARCREVWDIEVADEPHLFCLGSGILTHNSAMPESVTDRPAKALEYVFLLTKSERYYFDMEAVRQDGAGVAWNAAKSTLAANGVKNVVLNQTGQRRTAGADTHHDDIDRTGRNFRNADLWFQSIDPPHGFVGVGDELVGLDVTPEPFPGSHFACFPSSLVSPLILAGSSARGVCPACLSPWRRVVERTYIGDNLGKRPDNPRAGIRGSGLARAPADAGSTPPVTTGWSPSCRCDAGEPIPSLILDPFAGSGTTLAVAVKLKRRALGIELNPEYAALCEKRLAQPLGIGGLFDKGAPVVAPGLFAEPKA